MAGQREILTLKNEIEILKNQLEKKEMECKEH